MLLTNCVIDKFEGPFVYDIIILEFVLISKFLNPPFSASEI